MVSNLKVPKKEMEKIRQSQDIHSTTTMLIFATPFIIQIFSKFTHAMWFISVIFFYLLSAIKTNQIRNRNVKQFQILHLQLLYMELQMKK